MPIRRVAKSEGSQDIHHQSKEKPMEFMVSRTTQGAVSQDPPCRGAVRGPDSRAWPGEYQWFIELGSLEELMAFLRETGGGLGVFLPEEDEEHPVIEIFDDACAPAAKEREIAHRLVVDQRPADGAFDPKLVVVAGGEPRARLERVGWLPSDDVDGATDGATRISETCNVLVQVRTSGSSDRNVLVITPLGRGFRSRWRFPRSPA